MDDIRFSSSSNYVGGDLSNPTDQCSTRKRVSSNCRTHRTEDGRFIRKCENMEIIFRDCLGRPSEIVESKKEYIEDDVTDEMKKVGSVELGQFNLPSSDLLSNIGEGIERNIVENFNRFFGAVAEKGLFEAAFGGIGFPQDYDRNSPLSVNERDQQVPVDDQHQKESSKTDGEVDLSGLTREV